MGWLLAAMWGKGGLSGTLPRRTCMELSYRDGRPSCVDSGHTFPEYPEGPGSVSPEFSRSVYSPSSAPLSPCPYLPSRSQS